MNEESSRRQKLRAALGRHGFIRDRKITDAHRYTGKVTAAGREISLALEFADLEFTSLPTAELLSPETEAPNVVAHLFASGGLCFARREDVVLDRYDVEGTALLCLELARQGVERALTRKRVQEEISAEFPQHWQGHNFFYDLLGRQNEEVRIYQVPREYGGLFQLVTHNTRTVEGMSPSARATAVAKKNSVKAHVVNTDRALTFGSTQRPPANAGAFLEWIADYTGQSRETLCEIMSRSYPDTMPIFVTAPNGCVGITVELTNSIRKQAPRAIALKRLLERGNVPVLRYAGLAVDENAIYGRNMTTEKPMLGKRIALIGCGAIGGHLAHLLIHAGAGHGGGTLYLVDNQVLSPRNVGRHFLGPIHIGEPKAQAVRGELLRAFPEAGVFASTDNAISFLPQLMGYDLIIDATGEESLSVTINEKLMTAKAKEKAPDAIYLRLFGNGAAAQALLVDGLKRACFKCLRPVASGPWRYNPLRKGAALVTEAATCGDGQFLPYAIPAPVIAASLAVQMALDWSTGAPMARLRTNRIDHDSTEEVKTKNPPRAEECPCCAKLSMDS